MRSLRERALMAITILAAFSFTACGAGGDGDHGAGDVASDPSSAGTPTPGAEDSTTPAEPSTTASDPSTVPTTMQMTISPTGSVDPQELASDVETAVEVVDGWWRKHWSDYFTGRYTKPNVVGLYDGYDKANAPRCFGDPLPPGNAFYCPDGDYLAWDRTLIEIGYEIGDAWPYLIIAHEWGHAIQADLDMSLQSEKYELQADCLAGAALYGAASDHPPTLKFEQGDEKEIVDGLNYIADEVPWGMSGDHGDSFQRIEWFDKGRTRGVPGCLPHQVEH